MSKMNFDDMLTTNFIFCNNGCKEKIPIKEVSATKASALFDDYEKLSKENARLEQLNEALNEFKEKATPILRDVWFWETCPESVKSTIENLLKIEEAEEF